MLIKKTKIQLLNCKRWKPLTGVSTAMLTRSFPERRVLSRSKREIRITISFNPGMAYSKAAFASDFGKVQIRDSLNEKL